MRPLGVRIQAESYDAQSGIDVQMNDGRVLIGKVNNNDTLEYRFVDLGSGARTVTFSTASVHANGVIELHRDTATGPLLGTCAVPSTSNWFNFVSTTCPLDVMVAQGELTLVLRFQSPYPPTFDFMNIDWFVFNP